MRAAFLRTPLVELSAYAALHFLELLVGPKAAGLRVKDPAKLGACQSGSDRLFMFASSISQGLVQVCTAAVSAISASARQVFARELTTASINCCFTSSLSLTAAAHASSTISVAP